MKKGSKEKGASRKQKKRTKKSDSIQDLLSVAAEVDFNVQEKPKRNARKKLKFGEFNSETEDEILEQTPKRIDLKSSETIDYSNEDEIQSLDIKIISNQDPHTDQNFREIRFKLLKKYTQQYAEQALPYKWCIYEWFYSLGDEFLLRDPEFMGYLLSRGLVTSENRNCTFVRKDWREIRSKVPKPRRFSQKFLESERTKLQYYRKNLSTFRKQSHDFPGLILPGSRVLVNLKYRLVEATVDIANDEGYSLLVLNNRSKIFSLEHTVVKLEFSKPIPVPVNSSENNEVDPLNTLALAAFVSPRHNGDVRLLVKVIDLLKVKTALTQQLKQLNDEAEDMKNKSTPYPSSFKEQYARHILSIHNNAFDLKTLLVQLRESQENSPYRSLPKRIRKV